MFRQRRRKIFSGRSSTSASDRRFALDRVGDELDLEPRRVLARRTENPDNAQLLFEMTTPHDHSSNPLHGITLERMLTELVDLLGWEMMGRRVPIRCFTTDPSIKSSLAFLRRTPWARSKVEAMYLEVVGK